MLTDVAISGDRNVFKKGAAKILKCKNLTTDIQRMWNVEFGSKNDIGNNRDD
jgi:hypothetical protein